MAGQEKEGRIMRTKDIQIGAEYGIARTNSEYDTEPKSLFRARVIATGVKREFIRSGRGYFKGTATDGIEVEITDERGWGIWETGSRQVVIARQIVMTWDETLAARQAADDRRAQRDESQAKARARYNRVEATLVGRGLAKPYDVRGYSRTTGWTDSAIVPIEVLEALLGLDNDS